MSKRKVQSWNIKSVDTKLTLFFFFFFHEIRSTIKDQFSIVIVRFIFNFRFVNENVYT